MVFALLADLSLRRPKHLCLCFLCTEILFQYFVEKHSSSLWENLQNTKRLFVFCSPWESLNSK